MSTPPHPADRYGRSFADVYDEWYATTFDTDAAVATLIDLADGGPLLELGVGTGRLAIPIARAGLGVVGIDASAEMLERCPATSRLTTVLGDMRHVDAHVDRPDHGFRIAVCAFNTILNLTSPEAIGACVSSTRRLLASDGRLVLEGIVPIDPDLVPRRSLSPARIDGPDLVFVESEFDPVSRLLRGRHLVVRDDHVEVRPWTVLLVGPDELLAIAERSGFHVEHLWSDWRRAGFDDRSNAFVAVLRTIDP